MLFKSRVFVAAMLLLSPFITVVGHTLKADKSNNKCGKIFEETIVALTTRIDTLTMLVEQIAASVGNSDNNDSEVDYPSVTIKNKTPYEIEANLTYVRYVAPCNTIDFVGEGIASGDTWTESSSRGDCLVNYIHANVDKPVGSHCTPYVSSLGTSDSKYSIIMDGDVCCVLLSSLLSQKCS